MEAAIEESPNQGQRHGQEAGTSPPPPDSVSPVGGEGEEEEVKNEDDELIEKAQRLMEKITSSPDNPNPTVLHALSSLLETQESLYVEENGHSSFDNGRSSHNIGRLGNLVRENDEFFELISSKFLSESRYYIFVQAAAARLLMSCSLTGIYPHVFEEPVLENIKRWVMDESTRFSGEEHNWKRGSGGKEASDSQMLKTYSTGLLALCLAGGGQVVEDVLTSGLSSKLMRYLRVRVLGESASQKDGSYLTESKNATGAIGVRGKDEGRGRLRQILEVAHIDGPRIVGERCLDDQNGERDHDKSTTRRADGEECWIDEGKPPDGLAEEVDIYEVGADGEDRGHARDMGDEKTKLGDTDESGREDSSRRRANRGWARSRVKVRVNEGAVASEQALTSPGSNIRLGQGRARDRNLTRCLDVKKVPDGRKCSVRINADGFEREDNDDCFKECKVGTKDISDLVKKAVIAAEAEARAANAPGAAIKAAGDAAAEVVKSAALEEYKSFNDEDAAVLAASRAASTVIDAANAFEVSRNSSSTNADSANHGNSRIEIDEDVEEYFIPDVVSLAQLREKYCIQCLETLGEYVEVLGPVLHEKGVDVCLALLQRSSKQKGASEIAMLLPDVMKLICALAAHRKFAALFVDRGGMLKLLAAPRNEQTLFGLSSCLFAIGSLQGIMERVCALPSDVVHQVVELAVQLLECPQDQARKNAALFFTAAFVFRAVIDAFDAQDGLQKLLGLLNDAASVRSGVNSGTLGLSGSASHRNDRSPAEGLTSSEKQIAYHTCVALRQYFRALLLLLVDSIRPNKSNRGVGRNISSVRSAYKPLDISNEAIDAVFLQLQKDRKLGLAFVKTRWPAVEKFLGCNGHITMLELCQVPPVERYSRDLVQYVLSVLHIVTLVPNSRKMIVNATLSNNRAGIAVILDAANIASSYVFPEIIQPALNVLVNLVCPPPSISNKPPLVTQGQQPVCMHSSNGSVMETRDRHTERNNSDRAVHLPGQGDVRDRNGESSALDRGSAAISGSQNSGNPTQILVSTATSGLVGDRRISLGAGAGSAGLAAQLEQGYRQARDDVRANNGIKVLLHLLQPRIYSPPAALDCIRALACRVLLGLARDETIAHILTKLQVGKKLSELIRDSGSQTPGTEQGRWQAELAQVAIELIGIVTNSGRATTLAATDAATPTLRRIERAAIAAATPITYHSRELLQLIHEHLQASGLAASAATLLKEAQVTPLPSLAGPLSLMHPVSVEETPIQLQWPIGRIPYGFMSEKAKDTPADEDSSLKCDLTLSSKRKSLVFSPSLSFQSRNQSQSLDSHQSSAKKVFSSSKQSCAPLCVSETPSEYMPRTNLDNESQCKTPIVLPMKRKLSDLKDIGLVPGKQLNTGEPRLRSPACLTPNTIRKGSLLSDAVGFCTPNSNIRDLQGRSIPSSLVDHVDDSQYSNSQVGQATPPSQFGLVNDPHPSNSERLTLDSLVVQYLKHQHRQCPAPITTLPSLSLLHPHVCPESKRSLDAPSNVTARLGTREFRSIYGGVHGNRRDRQFVYSRFRPWRTCRDDAGSRLTCVTFLRDTSQIAVGSHSQELKIFDSNSNSVLESCISHQSPMTLVQSHLSSETPLLLSSSSQDVRLWDASSVSGGPMHSFEGCKAAQFSNSGNIFAALSSEPGRREILLYNVQTCQMESQLSDTTTSSTGRGHLYSLIHFSPSDSMLLWNGFLWDPRVSGPVHRFDQFTDYGGGGFHPAGNEVIINSEVWDLRKFRLLRSVPSLDQTTITFNAQGDVIYAILRRNVEDVMSAFHTRRCKHPLFAAFRTLDAINYSDIATIPVDRCVLDFATEPTDSFVGLITMDDQEQVYSSARVYEIGRRRPTDDDSDPDDAESEEEEDEDDDDVDPILGPDLDEDGESDLDDMSDEDDDDSVSELDGDDDDGEFIMDDVDLDGGAGILDIVTEGDEDENDSQVVESFSSDDEDYAGNVYGF
ncbi:DDB1- and CUL4-associated factor 1 isoform X1 [Tripterygium wilfordii]|uniref:DDB1- and CUL4-associated factor 1 isoform X1 n=1 Tax=Tripterygium wilfordii TaxID=458696 RepID=A0A7J7BWR9_TRIWF|nr:DDB1- and CUL4-associated factor homolog 1-like [Tripterygium wilfordii]KAF5726321.1 DDB1- and CUL4-associated factor 1 isoform X1 [Tripterygium wilfordii]